MILFNLKGQVGMDECILIIIVILLMLIVVILVIVMILVFVWKYCVLNIQVEYKLDWYYFNCIEVVVWLVFCVIIVIFGWIIWESIYKFDLYCLLDFEVKLVIIQVVLLDWKWLFIYLEQGIVMVNEIVFLKDILVNFQIILDLVMNLFFILQLGSQIYLMVGMMIKLYLIVNEEGVFDGIFVNYSGGGFFGMCFKVIVIFEQGFQDWVVKVKVVLVSLLIGIYLELVKLSENVLLIYFFLVSLELFGYIFIKYEYYGDVKGVVYGEYVGVEYEVVMIGYDMQDMDM